MPTTLKPTFPTSPNSPFQDGYDIAAEEVALQDLLEAENPDTTDPRWTRVMELESRKERLQRSRSEYRLRMGADRLVSNQEAADMRYIGALEDEDQDSMTLHTREAYRLFMGRSRDTEGNHSPIVGGRRVASALRSAWVLSGNDNPYADWVLIAFMDRMDSAKEKLETAIKECEKVLKELRQRGLSYSILRSREPKAVDLGFRSPYGYSVAELIVHYDYFVRLIKTLIRKDKMSDDEGRVAMRQRVREIRSMFEDPPKYERYLMREELRQLSRSDFLPGAGEESLKRVTAVVGLFGEVPRDVFTGKMVPRHSRRRANLSDQELRLLQEAALSPVAASNESSEEDENGLLE